MATAVGEIELDVKLTGDDISKTLHQISNSITEKFDSAFSDLSKNFEDVSTDIKDSFSKVTESISEKTEEQVSEIKNNSEQLGFSVSKSLNSVQEQANSVSNKMSGTLKKLGSAVIAAFSVAAIKNFGQQCIETAAQVNAANSQFEQTFGSMQTQAKSAIQTVAKESGILETRLQGVGTSIYAFAKTTGMDSANALNMMQEALQVTADSAAYYDRSLEDTAESLKSFLKGNYENDSALGLSCTETTRNTAANKLYGKSFTELSESQKQLTLLEMVKDANKLSGALGQASRESDGWENVTGNLKESWNQLLAVVGKPILQVATNVVQKLSSAISKLTEYAKGAVSALSELFNWGEDNDTANSISATANSAQSLSSEAENSSSSLENVADSAEKAKNSVAGFDKLNILSRNNDTSSGSNSVTDKLNNISNSVSDTASVIVEDTFSDFYEKSGLKKFFESDFIQGTSSVIVDAYSTITEENKKWVVDNKGTIVTFVDGIVNSFTTFKETITGIFDDIGLIISDWWFNNGGKEAFTELYDILLEINTFFMEVWIEHIQPLIDEAIEKFQNWWDGSGKEMFTEFLDFITSISDCIYALWQEVIKPFWNWYSKKVLPKITPFLSMIIDLLYTIVTYITREVTAAFKRLGGLADVITGILTGDIDKVKEGIDGFLEGVKDSVYNTAELVINILIDAYNGFAGSLFESYKKLTNGISNSFGLGDAVTGDYEKISSFSLPRLATGGLVKAPTLAVVGDNAGANTGDPEVIAPLSKLEGMLNTSNGEDTVILSEILYYLKKLYEMFVIFRNNGGNYYQFIAQINGSDIFNEIVKQNELYKNRHNGKSAFA